MDQDQVTKEPEVPTQWLTFEMYESRIKSNLSRNAITSTQAQRIARLLHKMQRKHKLNVSIGYEGTAPKCIFIWDQYNTSILVAIHFCCEVTCEALLDGLANYNTEQLLVWLNENIIDNSPRSKLL